MSFVRPSMLRTRPTVSVVVPCYNYGRYLDEVAASLRSQQSVDLEVIIVDDASPDGSGVVAERVAAALPNGKAIVHATNAGHIRTYNDGLSEATGDYLVLLSADDLLPPDAIARSVALLEAHPAVGFVYGYARSFSEHPPAPVDRVRSWSVWSGHRWFEKSARSGRCFVVSPEVVMRRAAYEQSGGYEPRLPHSADFHMWLRTAVNWDVARINGATQAWYRVHESNMHLTTYAGWLTDLEARRRTFDTVFDENLGARRELLRLRPIAELSLAKEALRRALLARHRGDDGDVARGYLDFAVRTSPSVTRTGLWHLCRIGPVRGRELPFPSQRQTIERVREHVLWRRERRYGF